MYRGKLRIDPQFFQYLPLSVSIHISARQNRRKPLSGTLKGNPCSKVAEQAEKIRVPHT